MTYIIIQETILKINNLICKWVISNTSTSLRINYTNKGGRISPRNTNLYTQLENKK